MEEVTRVQRNRRTSRRELRDRRNKVSESQEHLKKLHNLAGSSKGKARKLGKYSSRKAQGVTEQVPPKKEQRYFRALTQISIQGIPKKTKSLVRNKNVPNYRAKASLVLVIAAHRRHEEAAWHTGMAFRVKVDKVPGSVVALTQSRESEESTGKKGSCPCRCHRPEANYRSQWGAHLEGIAGQSPGDKKILLRERQRETAAKKSGTLEFESTFCWWQKSTETNDVYTLQESQVSSLVRNWVTKTSGVDMERWLGEGLSDLWFRKFRVGARVCPPRVPCNREGLRGAKTFSPVHTLLCQCVSQPFVPSFRPNSYQI